MAKAGAIREAGDAAPRRIFTSSDGHVIDGHHQWLVQKNPSSTLGYGLNHEKGAVQKQLLSMAGLRVDAADSARSQMFNLAQQFLGPQPAGEHGPSTYSALRTALGNEDADGARAEIQRLVTEGHKTPRNAEDVLRCGE